tara:strand:+ start:3927 stop:4256 length:330 start_codon:yes stop_codon:yes gene_type:complete
MTSGETLYKKYSKQYDAGEFWFGMTPSTRDVLNEKDVNTILFVLGDFGMVECPIDTFNELINNAKTTFKKDNVTIKHYHICISPPPDVKLFKTKKTTVFDFNSTFTIFD